MTADAHSVHLGGKEYNQPAAKLFCKCRGRRPI